MNATVLTLQSKGQIMIPKEWREEINTDVYQAVRDGDTIILKAVHYASDKEVMKAAKESMKKNYKALKSLANK